MGRRLGELKADYGVGGDTGTVVFQCEQYCARTLLQLLTAVIGTTQNVLAAQQFRQLSEGTDAIRRSSQDKNLRLQPGILLSTRFPS